MASPTVALVSRDLLFSSRLRAALGGGVEVALVAGAEVPEAATVFVDLNDAVEVRLALIRTLRARGAVHIVGFCGHDQREVRVRAMEHGADEVVTNGSLQQAAQRLVTGAHSGG